MGGGGKPYIWLAVTRGRGDKDVSWEAIWIEGSCVQVWLGGEVENDGLGLAIMDEVARAPQSPLSPRRRERNFRVLLV